MAPAADPYLSAIQHCTTVDAPTIQCVIISSVREPSSVRMSSRRRTGSGIFCRQSCTCSALQVLVQQYMRKPDQTKPELVIEIGPSGTLRSPITDMLAQIGREDVEYSSALARDQEDNIGQILHSVGRLFTRGYPIVLQSIQTSTDGSTPQVLTDLSPYAWNRRPLLDIRPRLYQQYQSRKSEPQGVLDAPMPYLRESLYT